MPANPTPRNTSDRPKREPRKPAGEKAYGGSRRTDTTPSETDFGGAWSPSPCSRVDVNDARAARSTDDGWVRAYRAEQERLGKGEPEIG